MGLLAMPVWAEEEQQQLLPEDDTEILDTDQKQYPPLKPPNLYNEPKEYAHLPYDNDGLKSCLELDDEINAILPATYRYIPGFYEDSYNAGSIWLGTTDASSGVILSGFIREVPIWYYYLGYSAYKRHTEEQRIRDSGNRIEVLRRVKARKRCYESY